MEAVDGRWNDATAVADDDDNWITWRYMLVYIWKWCDEIWAHDVNGIMALPAERAVFSAGVWVENIK